MAKKNGMAGDVLIGGEYQVPKIIRPLFLDACRAQFGLWYFKIGWGGVASIFEILIS